MASQEVRAPIVFAAVRSNQRARSIGLVLLALLAFIACASIHFDAQADSVAVSTHADFAARNEDDHELSSAAPEHRLFQQNYDTPSQHELGALEPDDSEVDTALHGAAVCLSVFFAPLLPRANQLLWVASMVWLARFLDSSALPRGPPYISR